MAYTAIAFKVAALVADEYEKREAAAQDDARARKIIRAVVAAINNAKEEIIDALNDLRIKELMGDVAGLAESLDDYLTISRTDNFLEEVLSRSGAIKGQFLQEVTRIDENADMAIEAYSGFATVISVRTLIFAEFKHKWGRNRTPINQEIRSEIGEALTHGEKVEKAVRRKLGVGSVGRYDSNAVEPGTPVMVWGYMTRDGWRGIFFSRAEAQIARDKYENELFSDTVLPAVLEKLEEGKDLIAD